MVELLRCKDRWERWIVLDQSQWTNHILDGHPELAGYERLIGDTLIAPEYVTKDRGYATREHFYRSAILPGILFRTFLNVCIDFQGSIGFVVTAFPTRRIQRGEQIRWP